MGRSHPSEADWHAYLAGDVPPPIAVRLERHLSACPICPGVLTRVGAVRSLLAEPPPEPDELSWRRMEARLGRTLQLTADAPLARSAPSLPPIEASDGSFLWSRRLAVAVALSAGLGLGLWSLVAPAPAPSAEVQRAALVATGQAGIDVGLSTGWSLAVSERTEFTLTDPDGDPLEVSLDHGALELRSPPELGLRAFVRTPDLQVWADSPDFRVAYVAGAPQVEVRAGHVNLSGPGISSRLPSGAVHPAPPRPSPSAASERPDSKPEPKTLASERAPPRPKSPAPPPPAKGETRAPATGETSVEVLGPSLGPARLELERAKEAWYRDGDAASASAAAGRALGLDSLDPASRLTALQIRCDAEVSRQSGPVAREACAQWLSFEIEPRQKRRVHFIVATIDRDQLGDCGSAIRHYGEALVFGSRRRFDDVVRLRRAECAIERGKWDLARSDLDRLRVDPTEPDRTARARARLEERQGSEHDRQDAK